MTTPNLDNVTGFLTWGEYQRAEETARAKKAAEKVRAAWCACKGPEDTFYYERGETGRHGWACRRCNGIVQTG